MPRSVTATDTFSTLCEIEGAEGDHYLIRKGKKNSRVIKVGDTGEGFTVETAKIKKEWARPTPEKAAPAAAATPAS